MPLVPVPVHHGHGPATHRVVRNEPAAFAQPARATPFAALVTDIVDVRSTPALDAGGHVHVFVVTGAQVALL